MDAQAHESNLAMTIKVGRLAARSADLKPPAGVHPQPSPVSPQTVIHDVLVVPLQRIPDERGTVMHMLRADDPHFRGFGEIYFSTIYCDVVKGWHRHLEMTLNYACVFGRIKFVMHDDRRDSPTRGVTQEVFLGPDHYALVQVPPGIWNGFKGMTDPLSIVANCATHVHDPSMSHSERKDPTSREIPYDWNVRCH
jgi:dTDP-4-dehydrorhamnose 3,5-epimerase